MKLDYYRHVHYAFEYRGLNCAISMHWIDIGSEPWMCMKPRVVMAPERYMGHMCAYVEVGERCFHGGDVNGDITYKDWRFPFEDKSFRRKAVVGWDYDHIWIKRCDPMEAYNNVKAFVDDVVRAQTFMDELEKEESI